MSNVFDALVVGGGPAGSACARALATAGARVAVIDRAAFPRVKLCAGWLSPAIWDALELSPREYPHGLWEWRTCHVHFAGRDHAVRGHGWFIRRYELDQFLLARSGAAVITANVKDVARDADGLWCAGGVRAPVIVGAGGTHCPVARMAPPPRPRRAVGVQELECEADPAGIARTRIGRDGEPELVLLDDLGGYGWNVSKSSWLNVGVGHIDAPAVRDAWQLTHAHLRAAGHVPPDADAQLAHVKGHSYYLFDPAHLGGAGRDGALLVGDSLGLAHPITAEGILPAVVSGRIAAEAILAGDVASYAARLGAHPLFADYARVHGLVRMAAAWRAKRGGAVTSGRPGRLAAGALAHGFAWLFSGARLPAPRLVDTVLSRRQR